VLTMNSIKILHTVRSAITAIAEVLVITALSSTVLMTAVLQYYTAVLNSKTQSFILACLCQFSSSFRDNNYTKQ